MKKAIFYFIIFFFGANLFSQQSIVDSLKKAISKLPADTNKIISTNDLAWELTKRGDFDEATEQINNSLKLSQQLKFEKGAGRALNILGVIQWQKGNYDTALVILNKALVKRRIAHDSLGEGSTLNNIGLIYMNRGNYPKALDNFFASLKIREKMKDKSELSSAYNNIGLIYDDLGDMEKAL